MKAKLDAIIKQEQAEYLDRLLPASDDLLAEMEAYAAEHRVPIADREVALFLEIKARHKREASARMRDGDRLFSDSLAARHGQRWTRGDDRSQQ